jgi:hypothetical protein
MGYGTAVADSREWRDPTLSARIREPMPAESLK